MASVDIVESLNTAGVISTTVDTSYLDILWSLQKCRNIRIST